MRLVLYDTENAIHHNELLRQRRLCGWGEDEIPTWTELIRSKQRVRRIRPNTVFHTRLKFSVDEKVAVVDFARR